MKYRFESIDDFLFSFETELVNLLHDYGLLEKFSMDVKKIFFYIFIKKFNERLENKNLLFFHNRHISEDHELCSIYGKEQMEILINKICDKVKSVTGKLFFIKRGIKIPKQQYLNLLDGEILDEILILENNSEINPKKLKEFLKKHHLKDMFSNLAKKL